MHGVRRKMFHRFFALALGAVILVLLAPPQARADLRLCNRTGMEVGVAIGYNSKSGWISEGWWNLKAEACETLISGALDSRYYYVYAAARDYSAEWTGAAQLCTSRTKFSIKGTEDCLVRGYDRHGFFEIDTGEQTTWTVQLIRRNGQTQSENAPHSVKPLD